MQLLVDERLEDRGGDVGMVVGAQRVADVVEQRHHDIVLALAAAVGAGRGLQRMLEPVDREAAIIAVEQLQMGEHAVGQAAAIGRRIASR